MKIIIIIIGLQPSGRFLAPTPSISPYPQPSSSFLHMHLSFFLQDHYLLLYFPPFQHLFIFHLVTPAYFFNPLHNHISNACNLLISSCNNVHVSHPYNTTGHTNTLTILFFSVLLSPLVKRSFL